MESSVQSGQKPSWLKPLTMAAVVLVVGTLLAPLAAIAAVPVLVILTIHHTIAMARTSGSIVPFAVLIGFDLLMLVVVIGSVLSHLL